MEQPSLPFMQGAVMSWWYSEVFGAGLKPGPVRADTAHFSQASRLEVLGQW